MGLLIGFRIFKISLVCDSHLQAVFFIFSDRFYLELVFNLSYRCLVLSCFQIYFMPLRHLQGIFLLLQYWPFYRCAPAEISLNSHFYLQIKVNLENFFSSPKKFSSKSKGFPNSEIKFES